MTKCGRVTEIKPNEPKRVKTDTCPGKFCKVLKTITRRWTSMISNDAQSHAVLLIVFIVLLWMRIIKFALNKI